MNKLLIITIYIFFMCNQIFSKEAELKIVNNEITAQKQNMNQIQNEKIITSSFYYR